MFERLLINGLLDGSKSLHLLGLDVVEVLPQGEMPDGAVLGQPHQQSSQVRVQT